MGIEGHLQSLERKHSELETAIHQAVSAPAVDDLHINDLKRKKLLIKEEIEKLKSQTV